MLRTVENLSEMAQCMDCRCTMKYIYDWSLRPFCFECDIKHEVEAYRLAKKILRSQGRR